MILPVIIKKKMKENNHLKEINLAYKIKAR